VTAELLDLAAGWCRAAVRAGARFAQAYAETGLDVRMESRGPDRLGLLADRRAGVGLLVRRDESWSYGSASAGALGELADWLTALTGTAGAAGPVDWPALADRHDESVALFVGADAGRSPGGTDPRCVVTEDLFCRDAAVVDSDGTTVHFGQTGIRRRATATVMTNGGSFRGYSRWYGDNRYVDRSEGVAELVATALSQAGAAANGTSLGSRTTPVVLAPGAGAGLLHELIGHALEADNLANGSGYPAGLPGAQVTTEHLTLTDQPDLPSGFGSAPTGYLAGGAPARVDDEGTPATTVLLVDRGVVAGRLSNRRTAGSGSTGHGRRRTFRYPPIPRATNTVVAAGPDSPAGLLDPGATGLLYVRALGAGDVDLRRGDFSFAVTEGYFLTPAGDRQPVPDVTLFGDARQALGKLVGVAADSAADNVTCAKQGQFIGIGLVSPTMRFDDLTWRS
jgi:TldD protein